MKIGVFPVEKVSVRLPEPIKNVNTNWKNSQGGTVEFQSAINPALSEVAVHLVSLSCDHINGVMNILNDVF